MDIWETVNNKTCIGMFLVLLITYIFYMSLTKSLLTSCDPSKNSNCYSANKNETPTVPKPDQKPS